MGKDRLYKVAYDEAVRALSEQQVAIDGFRSRAGILFSADTVMTSFLAGQALRGGDGKVVAYLALAMFVSGAMTLLAILWPRRWDFAIDSHAVIGTYIESSRPASIGELHRELSFHMHSSYLRNESGLRKLFVYVQVANVLIAVELLLWILAIAIPS